MQYLLIILSSIFLSQIALAEECSYGQPAPNEAIFVFRNADLKNINDIQFNVNADKSQGIDPQSVIACNQNTDPPGIRITVQTMSALSADLATKFYPQVVTDGDKSHILKLTDFRTDPSKLPEQLNFWVAGELKINGQSIGTLYLAEANEGRARTWWVANATGVRKSVDRGPLGQLRGFEVYDVVDRQPYCLLQMAANELWVTKGSC